MLFADSLIGRSGKGQTIWKTFVPERGRFDQPERTDKPAWAHPVIANGKLYIRDQDTLFCYDVKQKEIASNSENSVRNSHQGIRILQRGEPGARSDDSGI